MTPLLKHLLDRYPHGIPTVTQFCADNPDILPIRRARGMIETLASQPDEVTKCFRKRGGRWHIDVTAYANMMEDERPIIESEVA